MTTTKSNEKKSVTKKQPERKKVIKKVTKKSTKKVVPAVETPVVETPIVETPVVETPVVETPVVEEVLPVENVVKTENEGSTFLSNDLNITDKKVSKKPTKDDIQRQFDELFKLYEDELKTRKQPKQDVSLYNYLNKLKNNTYKVLKIKTRNVDSQKTNMSGFMKPVNVSDELRNFIHPLFQGEEMNEPVTRVLITKKLCQYIKENNLQKPEDKREILPDDALTKLFGIGSDESEKLTYYSMQKRVQSHIFKV